MSADRQQFGVPIGSFQAVQHKAVDMHVAIERARALAYFAALTIAADDPRRRLAAAMAKAAAGECQSLVFRHGLQLFGAMGFTWENDLQFALKRAKAGELMLGGAAEHRATRSPRSTGVLDAADFRSRRRGVPRRVRRVPRRATCPPRPRPWSGPARCRTCRQWARRWQRLLFDNGWLLPGQPPEFGGRNATVLQQFVHLEELCRRRIYHSFNPQGVGIIAASLLSFGTDEQKQRWAVPVLRARCTASLGMSEPSAGSDLASLRTRAVLDGDHFVVNGQKVWTSGAHDADCPADVRAHRPGRAQAQGHQRAGHPDRHCPAWSAGRSPSICGDDDLDFNEVFFADVRVPAENLVGPLNGGWGVANGSLGHERTMMWLGFADRIDNTIGDFGPQTPLERDQYASTHHGLSGAAAAGFGRAWPGPRAGRSTSPACRCSSCSVPRRSCDGRERLDRGRDRRD